MILILLLSWNKKKLISDHNFFVAKLKIFQISMVDWFGGAKTIPVKDYLAYNYTGSEIYDYYYKAADVGPVFMETDGDDAQSNERYVPEP